MYASSYLNVATALTLSKANVSAGIQNSTISAYLDTYQPDKTYQIWRQQQISNNCSPCMAYEWLFQNEIQWAFLKFSKIHEFNFFLIYKFRILDLTSIYIAHPRQSL